MGFKNQLEEYQKICEQSLQEYADLLFQDDSKVSEAARYSLLNGGKRVRGVLVLAVCDFLQGDRNAGKAYAAALEMMHAFSLIHDDLPCMDDDALRRGKPSTHIVYGEATALLAGDMLAIQAFETLAKAKIAPENTLQAVQILASAAGARGMIFGQELDLYYEEIPADQDALYRIHRHKTAALISAAVTLGVCTTTPMLDKQKALACYSENIGLVFQIVDDILDSTSSEDVLGKPIGSDKENGKTTFVSLFGVEASQKKAEELTQEAIESLQKIHAENASFLIDYAQNLTNRLS